MYFSPYRHSIKSTVCEILHNNYTPNSPFIGRPEDPFFLLKPSRDNFYVDVIRAFETALNISPSFSTWVTPVLLGGMRLLSVGGLIFFSFLSAKTGID
jgi:hypothetical protein